MFCWEKHWSWCDCLHEILKSLAAFETFYFILMLSEENQMRPTVRELADSNLPSLHV